MFLAFVDDDAKLIRYFEALLNELKNQNEDFNLQIPKIGIS